MGLTLGLALGCQEGDPVFGPSDDDGGGAEGCGEVGCSNGLRVSLVAQGRVFDAGHYVVTVTTDAGSDACQFRVSGDQDECGNDPPCALGVTCEADFNFSIEPHTIGFIVGPNPDLVDLGISRDGSKIADSTLAPEYDEYTPNGSDCPPVCLVATASVSVP